MSQKMNDLYEPGILTGFALCVDLFQYRNGYIACRN